ncbi:MAG TPA: BPSL0067 family protein [Blastocatellia bacterium]|nr:BPSL0067 family protein [Blastocatellia bacterium]
MARSTGRSKLAKPLRKRHAGRRRPQSMSEITSVMPAVVTQGATVSLTVQGTNTNWANGQTTATFDNIVTDDNGFAISGAGLGDEGISVSGQQTQLPGSVTVIDATDATVQVMVTANAALGAWNLTMDTPPADPNGITETESLTAALTITGANPPGNPAATVTTIAGVAGSSGLVDGAGSSAKFNHPSLIAVGPDDSIYVADKASNCIRVVKNVSGQWTVSTYAGSQTAGFADGPAASAKFSGPEGVAVDSSGVVYVVDRGNNRIRKIATDGTVSTFAGSGAFGHADGQGTAATFFRPLGIAIDSQNNLYVTDGGIGGRIRMIDPSANVRTIGGNGIPGSSDSPSEFSLPSGIAFDNGSSTVYVADTGNQRIRTIVGTTAGTYVGSNDGFEDGPLASALFAQPRGVATDGDGHLLVTDASSNVIRVVDLNPASQTFTPSVATLGGTGQNSSSDGTGAAASFSAPWGIAVSQSSAIYVADNGSNTIRRILFAPIITSFTPTQGGAGNTVTITGHYFDGRSPSDDTVSFTKTGGGLTAATVTAATRTQLVVTVPSDATSGPITVQTQGGTAASATNFQVSANAPHITGFNPNSGVVGGTVAITGTQLKGDAGGTTVTFAGNNGARISALITSLSATEVDAIVPNGAMTGAISVTTAGGTASTATAFTVNPGRQDYQMTVTPSSASLVLGTSTNYVVYLNSSLETFSQLATLIATGLPTGATAGFSPGQITSGAQSTMNVNTSGSSIAPGSYSFTISATALVNGAPLVRTSQATLTVLASGQTTLSGRVLSTDDQPILGVTVSLDGQTATTDAAGGFLLSGIHAGVNRPLLIDGTTASAANRTYPVITEPATVVANQANQNQFNYYLLPIDTQYEVDIVLDQNGAVANDTPVTNPRIPGVVMTIPKGAHLLNRDGTPVTRVSITPVPIDRPPAPLPAAASMPIIFTSQPGGATSNIAIPVVYPNISGVDPGTKVPLFYFNHDTVQWEQYGVGDVSGDGRTIAPEIDPNTNRSYGLPDFSWHGPAAGKNGDPGDSSSCPTNITGNPVDLSTGIKIIRDTDISFGGARGGLTLQRVYTSDLAATVVFGRFGRGFRDNFDVQVSGNFVAGGAGRVRLPDQSTGWLFSYSVTNPDGSLVFTNSSVIAVQGDTLTKAADGSFLYRYKHGGGMVFDQTGRLSSLRDRNGNTTSLTYDASGNLTQLTDAVGRSVTLAYTLDAKSGRNVISSATDPLGRTWTYTYTDSAANSGGQLSAVTDPLGNSLNYTYDPVRIVIITDKRGITETIAYDSSGNDRVTGEGFADDSGFSFSYTLSGGFVTGTSIFDSEFRTNLYRFNQAGYVTSQTDGLGQTTTIQRDLVTNQSLSTVGPCGCAQLTNTYDGNGNVLTSTDRLGNTETFQHEPVFNNVTRYTDKLGRVTNFGYDSNGNLLSVTRAAGTLNLTTSFGYDSFGELTSVTDPLGHTAHFEYDGNGNLTARVDPLSNRTTFQYDLIGRPTSVTDPLSRATSMVYNALYLTDETAPAGATTHFDYDAHGNRIAVTDALQNKWTYSYDLKNNNTSVTDPVGQKTAFAYDSLNELNVVTSASGRITKYFYDKRGQLSTLRDPLFAQIGFAYDSQGNLAALTDQRGNTTTYGYDELFRPISRTDPVGNTSTVTYDAMDNVVDAVDRLGRHIQTSYDDVYRPTTTVYSDATVTRKYDAASRLSEIDDTEGGNINWAYDDADRILSETTPAGVVSYLYNAANQRTSMTAADRPVVTYGYDGAGRLQTITQGSEVFTYGYDALSRRSSLQRPNGVTTRYLYDQASRLIQLTHTNSGGQQIENFQYLYNLDDEISSITSLNSTPLTPRPATAGAADAANRITQFGPASYTFDNEGETTSKTDSAGTTNYQWDARGRLTQATVPGGQTVGYSYDALGRRSSRSASSVTANYLYDGLDVALDRASDGSSTSYINGSLIDERLEQSRPDGPLYFTQDRLGSTAALTDRSGNLVESESYGPFGAATGSALTRYGFTGRELDSNTGLMFYRARWYGPEEGRFLSEDSIAMDQFMDLYEYACDSPANFVDALGLDPGPSEPPSSTESSTLAAQRARRGHRRKKGYKHPSTACPCGAQPKGPFVVPDVDKWAIAWPSNNGKKVGDGECVTLVRTAAPSLPPTWMWRQGPPVKGNTSIARGTVIANFINGRWPGRPFDNHSALYVSQDDTGIDVIDQWPSKAVGTTYRHIGWAGNGISNSANAFYVVFACPCQ